MIAEILVNVSFLNHTTTKSDAGIVEGDYNTTKLVFNFAEDVAGKRIVFKMSNPAGELIFLKELTNNEILLVGKDAEGNSYSLFSEFGLYPFELVLYGEDSKLTSAPGWMTVSKRQVSVLDSTTMPYLPLFDNLLNDLGDSDRVFIRFSKNADGSGFTADWKAGSSYIGVAVGQTAPTNAADYKWYAAIDKLAQASGDSETQAMSQKAITDYVVKHTKEYIPLEATHNLASLEFENAMLVSSTGVFQITTTGLGSAAARGYIELKDDERTYTLSWASIMPNQTIYFYQYDAEKKFLNRISKTIWETPPKKTSVTFDDGCKYIRIQLHPFDNTQPWKNVVPVDFQVEAGSEATEYVPPFIIPNSMLGIMKQVYSVLNSRTSQTVGNREDVVMSQKATTDAISEALTERPLSPMKTAYTTEAAEDPNVSSVDLPRDLGSFVGWCLPIRKDKFPVKTVGISLRVVSNMETLSLAIALYDQNHLLIKELAQETLSLRIWNSETGIYATEHTFSCNLARNFITTEVAYIRVYIPNTTASSPERLHLGFIKANQASALNKTDINVKETPAYYNVVSSSSQWRVHHYNLDENNNPIPASFNFWLRLKQEDKNAFPYASYGLPVLELSGSTLGMNKDNNVTLSYKYGDRTGSCTLKWQGSSSIAYPKKNYTIKFDSKFEANTGWGEQKKYCLKANYIDFTHARNLVSAKLWGNVVKSRTSANNTLNALVNAGAVDGFPICLTINGEYQGLYTFNIPKDGWMFGMGEEASTAQMAILCADAGDETGAKVCSFKALATVTEADLEIEYATNEDDTDWIKTSVNRLIQACIDSDGTDLDTTIAQYLDWESAIDYYIFCLLSRHFDGITKNYLLVTYDGTKWFFSAYDLDSTFGLWFNGSKFTNVYGYDVEGLASQHRIFELIKKYKAEELKERYRKLVLKTSGALNEESIIETFSNFICKIPKALLDEDIKIWPTLPSTTVNNVSQIIDFNRRRRALIDPQIEQL